MIDEVATDHCFVHQLTQIHFVERRFGEALKGLKKM